MALEVIVYTVEARERAETPYPASDFHTQDYDEARKYAQDNRLLLIENTYEWADSQPVDDFAPMDWVITYGGNSNEVDDEPEVVDRFATEEEARGDLASLYSGDSEYRVRRWPEDAQYPDEG